MKSVIILLLAILPLINVSAQRNKDSGGRGTESTRINRIKRISDDHESQQKIVSFKERESNNNILVQQNVETGIFGGVVVSGNDVIICTNTSPEKYNEMDTDFNQSLIDLGIQQFNDGNFYAAIYSFTEAIKLSPNVKELYIWRGK
ncbi:MAG: hypothetical protein HKM87_07170, partial [Ignavibacteriaceae bacterium]|nr:hypothetical protein [Ignavibacteriaceae bacterium]